MAENISKQLAAYLAGLAVFDAVEQVETSMGDILATADEEGVMPLFLFSLSAEQRAAIEPAFLSHCGLSIDRYVRNLAAGDMLWLDELLKVGDALAEAWLPFLVFKGAALAYSLYDQSFLRVRCDVDLLVKSRQDADRIWELLQAFGYQRDNAVDGKLITSEFYAYKKCIADVVAFDVHWNTSNAAHCRSLSFDELYTDSVVIDEISDHVHSPSLVHGFVLACHHRIAHKPEGRHNRLIWLYDLHLMLNKFGEAEKRQLVDVIERHDIAPVCLDGILASVEYFGTEVEREWLSRIQQLAARSGNQLPAGQSLLSKDIAAIRRQHGMLNKLLIVKEYTFPSLQYMMKKYGFSSPLVSPFFYLKRALSGLKKRLR
jgi:hypothetical protein